MTVFLPDHRPAAALLRCSREQSGTHTAPHGEDEVRPQRGHEGRSSSRPVCPAAHPGLAAPHPHAGASSAQRPPHPPQGSLATAEASAPQLPRCGGRAHRWAAGCRGKGQLRGLRDGGLQPLPPPPSLRGQAAAVAVQTSALSLGVHLAECGLQVWYLLWRSAGNGLWSRLWRQAGPLSPPSPEQSPPQLSRRGLLGPLVPHVASSPS